LYDPIAKIHQFDNREQLDLTDTEYTLLVEALTLHGFWPQLAGGRDWIMTPFVIIEPITSTLSLALIHTPALPCSEVLHRISRELNQLSPKLVSLIENYFRGPRSKQARQLFPDTP